MISHVPQRFSLCTAVLERVVSSGKEKYLSKQHKHCPMASPLRIMYISATFFRGSADEIRYPFPSGSRVPALDKISLLIKLSACRVQLLTGSSTWTHHRISQSDCIQAMACLTKIIGSCASTLRQVLCFPCTRLSWWMWRIWATGSSSWRLLTIFFPIINQNAKLLLLWATSCAWR